MSKKKAYAIRTPLGVKGGIRAQHARGGRARVWWARRWLDMMEGFRLGARFGRGRNYAVSGQVSALNIRAGEIFARVQGSDTEPYESVIRFRTLTDEERSRVIQRLRQRPMLVARLLVGDLPMEVETVFTGAGCPLFPSRNQDVSSRCSCPDWANPCKHLAAVYYLLGEALARNPFLLLTLRGLSRDELIGPSQDRLPYSGVHVEEPPASPLTAESFYGVARPPVEDFGEVPPASAVAPLIQRLGPLPFWRGQERFSDTLEHLYARAAPRGLAVWTDDVLDLRREEEKVIIKGGNLRLRHNRLRVDGTL